MPENSSLVGDTLGQRYKIIEQLTTGGIGETYLAEDLDGPADPKPRCVVKRIQPNMYQPEILRLFRKEGKTLGKLGCHDQIPTLYDYFEENQEFYLVQELIEGHDLRQEITPGRRWSEAEVIKFLQEILGVLEFVHHNEVIHRDIKPANIMRRQGDGKLVLIDFGAVKEVSTSVINEQGEVSSTIVVGTPGYMPNEQMRGKPRPSSDIYAVGMTAIFALTGVTPTELEDGDDEVIWRDRVQVSDELANILTYMVQFNAAERYASATEVLQALREIERDSNATEVAQPLPEPTTIPMPEPRENLGGQEPLDSDFYVERPPIESECYETIANPGALIWVKAPQQMGKSLLMSRILEHAKQQGYQQALLNFQLADGEYLSSLDKLLQWFCHSVSNRLDIEDRRADYWQDNILGSKNKCTNYFQRHLLSSISSPLVLGLDNVDKILQHQEVAIEFLGLLRAWHERGRNEEDWKKLRLVIVYTQEVYIPLNTNQSPFNVGLLIDLRELNQAEVADLVRRHELDWSDEQVERLMAMVGGHPYLVRKALYQIAWERMTLERLLQVAPTEEGPYAHHLGTHLDMLENNADLAAAIKQVLAVNVPVPLKTAEASKLRSMGLVKFQGNAVILLCDLYRRYFGDRLQ